MTQGDLERIGELLDVTAPGYGQPIGPDEAPQGAETGSCAEGAPRSSHSDLRGEPARLLAAIWAQVVGPEVAQNAQPVHCRNGRLVVSTSSTAWAHTLQDMSENVRSGLNARLGHEYVKRVVFRHAGWGAAGSSTESASAESGPEALLVGVPRPGSVQSSELRSAPELASAAGLSAEANAVRGGFEDRGESRGRRDADESAGNIEEVLTEVESLPIEPGLKTRIQGAMRAALVRDQQDSVRSERTKKEAE